MFAEYDLIGEDGDLSGTVFRDVLTGFAAFVLLLFVVAVVWLNEPQKEQEDETKTRGNVRVELIWPNDLNSDVDLWCMAPGDAPVGWSNKGSPILNLVRDDLGTLADFTGMNYEIQFSRGLPKGEWICNAHWYANHSLNQADDDIDGQGDGLRGGNTKNPRMKMHDKVPLKVVITVRKEDDGGKTAGNIDVIETQDYTLTRVGQEITLARFRLDSVGNIVKGSVNNVFKRIMIEEPMQ